MRLVTLTSWDEACLAGAFGGGASFAMRILVRFADAIGAGALLDIEGAHVDGCLYHGQAGLDFVDRMRVDGGRVRVPTTLNVGALDLIHPDLVRLPAVEAANAARLMQAHIDLGCQPSFTCAPYQTRFRPRFGEQIAWGESNAIVFANSVIGARTNRYGDFIDLCCAMTGRAPAWGLHLDENRYGQVLLRLEGFPDPIPPSDVLYTGVGIVVGQAAGDQVPVIEGLPTSTSEDQLKALGAAAASSGSVGLFHAIGITPEAATHAQAFGGKPPARTVVISPVDVSGAVAALSSVPEGATLSAVCLGTPHFSRAEWTELRKLLQAAGAPPRIPIYVHTARETLLDVEQDGSLAEMTGLGIIPVVDTCSYITPILNGIDGAVMTNSGKWAHYAPANVGLRAAFGDMRDCVASALVGRLVRREPW